VNSGSVNLTNTTNPFTFTFWFRPNTNKIAYNVLQDYRKGRYTVFGNLNLFKFSVDYDPIETNFLVIFNNVTPLNVFTSKYGDTVNNSWLHASIVIGNLQPIKLYINGELLTSVDNSNSVGNLGITIGNSNYAQPGQNRFKGWLKDYRVYNRELSSQEVLVLYEFGNIDYELKLSLEEID
jgi:hypothetical protein